MRDHMVWPVHPVTCDRRLDLREESDIQRLRLNQQLDTHATRFLFVCQVALSGSPTSAPARSYQTTEKAGIAGLVQPESWIGCCNTALPEPGFWNSAFAFLECSTANPNQASGATNKAT